MTKSALETAKAKAKTKKGKVKKSDYKLHIKDYFVEVYVDDYEQGQGTKAVNSYSEKVNKSFDGISDLLEYVRKSVTYAKTMKGDLTVMDDTIRISMLVDGDNSPASDNDIFKWENGKKELYSAEFTIPVYLVKEVGPTEKELSDIVDSLPD